MSALNSKIASFAAQVTIAAQKKSDVRVGFEAARTPQVRERIERYNAEVTEAYAVQLLSSLDDQLKI